MGERVEHRCMHGVLDAHLGGAACEECTRLKSDGQLVLELYSRLGVDLSSLGFERAQVAETAIRDRFKELRERIEQLEVQLAAIGVASHDGSKEMEVVPYSWGWSPAYADVLKLRRGLDLKLRREVEELRVMVAIKTEQLVKRYAAEVISCRNIGYDLTCGACAEKFYTGSIHNAHKSKCETNPLILGTVVR